MSELEPLQHIVRPDLPWRAADRTRCGREVAEIRPERIITVEQARAKVRDLGQQRAAMSLCMVCAHHVTDWPEWNADPVTLLGRYLSGGMRGLRPAEYDLTQRELRAIAALIAAHRDEFDEYVAGLADTIDLATRRKGKR